MLAPRPNIVVLSKNKLISIDSILPLLMEMKNSFPKSRFIIVLPNQMNKSLLMSNVNIWECLQSLDPVISVRPAGRLRLLLWSIGIFTSLAFRRNLIMKFADTFFRHRSFIKILRIFSRVTEVKVHILPGCKVFNVSCYKQYQLHAEKCGRKNAEFNLFPEKSDYILSSLGADLLDECCKIKVESEKLIKVGYLRSLLSWRTYVAEATRRHKIVGKRKHIIYILTTMGKTLNSFQEPEIGELLKETLFVLKNYNENFHTIFRPHAITDIEKLKQILQETEYSNFSIDYGHPMILSSNAVFAIGNFFSAALFDAYFMNVPIVEYSSYDRDLLELVGRTSIAGQCCDFFIDRDVRKLDETIKSLIEGKSPLARDPAIFEECFPDTNPDILPFFGKLLGLSMASKD